jgi:hypothetical protein
MLLFFLLISLGLAALAFFLLRSGWRMLALIKRVNLEGQMLSATLEQMSAKTVRAGQDSSTSYYATIVYAVSGESYSRELPISRKHYHTWNKGMSLEVKYLPTKPETVFLVGENMAHTRGVGAIAGGILFFLTAASILVITSIFAPVLAH